MGNVRGHPRDAARRRLDRLAADRERHGPLEHHDQRIERRGVLGEALALLEREQGDVARALLREHPARDAVLGVAEEVLEAMRLAGRQGVLARHRSVLSWKGSEIMARART